jgi:lipid II:glycine glycyltransferase (peptidoglycan interpeptide bridge formation enzyme)
MNIQPQRVPPTGFDTSISNFDGVVQEMTVAFAAARWPRVTLEPWLYTIGDELVAAALVMVQKLPLSIGKLAIVKWGPILAREDHVERENIHQAAVAHLQSEYSLRQRMMLTIMARADRPPSLNAHERLVSSGFHAGSKLLFPDRYLVNLRLSDAEQRQSFQQKWRYHLNKSEKENLSFTVAEASDLPVFDQLYTSMSDRKRFPDHSAYGTVQSLFASPTRDLHPRIFLVHHGEIPVAGALIFTAGKTAVYLYGATNDEALRLRAGYFMHARLISWLRDNTRADWYDLGGTDGFHGLHQFKKGMIGRAGLITPVPPMANFAAHPKARVLGTVAYGIKDRLHGVRRLIDRHRGSMAQPDQSEQS